MTLSSREKSFLLRVFLTVGLGLGHGVSIVRTELACLKVGLLDQVSFDEVGLAKHFQNVVMGH